MKKDEFEERVLRPLQSEKIREYISKYYKLDAAGNFYQLQSWDYRGERDGRNSYQGING